MTQPLITKEEINALPQLVYDGPIHLVDDEERMAMACEALRHEHILGFDTETKPVFVRGVSYPPALVQLAGEQVVYVFQLLKLPRQEPLLRLFENMRITKAGVALADDLKKLRETQQFQPAGFADISTLCKQLHIHQTGLRSLAARFMGVRISKREQRSNWARESLTPSQLTYAATDAWVSRKVYLHLCDLLKAQQTAEMESITGTAGIEI